MPQPRRQSDPYGHAASCRRNSRTSRIEFSASVDGRHDSVAPAGRGSNDATTSPAIHLLEAVDPVPDRRRSIRPLGLGGTSAPIFRWLSGSANLATNLHGSVWFVGPIGRPATLTPSGFVSLFGIGELFFAGVLVIALVLLIALPITALRSGGSFCRADSGRRSGRARDAAIRFRVRTALVAIAIVGLYLSWEVHAWRAWRLRSSYLRRFPLQEHISRIHRT